MVQQALCITPTCMYSSASSLPSKSFASNNSTTCFGSCTIIFRPKSGKRSTHYIRYSDPCFRFYAVRASTVSNAHPSVSTQCTRQTHSIRIRPSRYGQRITFTTRHGTKGIEEQKD
jgi:hypothetical protein